jgi:hypothetical protein
MGLGTGEDPAVRDEGPAGGGWGRGWDFEELVIAAVVALGGGLDEQRHGGLVCWGWLMVAVWGADSVVFGHVGEGVYDL